MGTVGLDAVRKLRAFEAGRPLPLGDSLTTHVAEPEHLAALAFVRMGGEARPWAVGFKRESDAAQEVWSVSDGRRAGEVEAMLVEVAGRLGMFLGSPVLGGYGNDRDLVMAAELDQVWLPNGAHLDMLHMLGLRYALARRTAGGEEDGSALEALKALGRASGYLFRESGCSTEVGVVDASRALRSAYTFPVDDLRAAHLGLLVALLDPNLDREALIDAAETAESLSISTTLDPVLERDALEPLVGSDDPEDQEKVQEVLKAEITRRLDLTLAAADILRRDERIENAGVEHLVEVSKLTRWYEYLRTEATIAEGRDFFPPSPETDRKRKSAAKRYMRMAGADEVRDGLLVAHDLALVDEAVASGDAIRGSLVKIERRVPPGKKQKAIFWEVELPEDALVRVKVPGKVTSFDLEVPDGELLELAKRGDRTAAVIRMIRQRTAVAADTQELEGQTVTFLPVPVDFSRQRRKALSRDSGAGQWLTHGEGAAPETGAGESGEDLLAEVEALRR